MKQTGEQIVGLWYRSGASFFDILIFGSACAILQLAFFNQSYPEPEIIRAIVLLPILLWPLCWWAFGRTPGGWLMSSRVVNNSNQTPSLLQATWRFVVMASTVVPLGSGHWAAYWHDERKTWFDRLSGTKVVGDESFLPPGEVKF